jgi:hypothetical protein
MNTCTTRYYAFSFIIVANSSGQAIKDGSEYKQQNFHAST